MTEAERKVIEAARAAYKDYEEYMITNKKTLSANLQYGLADALQALDVEQAEHDYKWLAYSPSTLAYKFTKKPTFDKGFWRECSRARIIAPAFLKPGQLWERMKYREIIGNQTQWNGYWWRLIENHGEKEDDSQFKKGDLVRHKHTRCVGNFVTQIQNEIIIHIPNVYKSSITAIWRESDCEPDKQPVDAGLYEAAVQCVAYGGLCGTIDDLESALAHSTPVKPQEWIPIEEWDYMKWPTSATFIVTMKEGRSFWPGIAVVSHRKLMPLRQKSGKIVAFKPFGDLFTPTKP